MAEAATTTTRSCHATHPRSSTDLGHLPSYPKRPWVRAQCSPLSHLLPPSLPAALGFHLKHPGLVPAPSVFAAPITDQATVWGCHPTTGKSLQGQHSLSIKSPAPPETPPELSTLMAEHPDRRAASPREPDSGRALIYLAVNPDEPRQRQGQRHSPWHFPFCIGTRI